MAVNDKAKELAIAIMDTKEFLELKRSKSIIDKKTELKNKIEAFKNKESTLYSGKLSASEEQQRVLELRKAFESLSSIPEIAEFLKAERNFNSLIQKVYKTIGSTLESSIKP